VEKEKLKDVYTERQRNEIMRERKNWSNQEIKLYEGMTEGGNKRTTNDQVFCSCNSSMPVPECLYELHANRQYADSRST
jgi:hypothetical protein